MIETYLQPLPHAITLSCRAAGTRGRPVLDLSARLPRRCLRLGTACWSTAQPEHGGYRVAPISRIRAVIVPERRWPDYRPKHLVQDILALIDIETGGSDTTLACLIAHDWGGAVCLEPGQPPIPEHNALSSTAAPRHLPCVSCRTARLQQCQCLHELAA